MNFQTKSYAIGAAPTLTAKFRLPVVPPASKGVLTNPTVVTFRVTDPLGAVTSYSTGNPAVTNPSVGLWVCQLPTLTVAGVYNVKVTGTGAVNTAESSCFTVVADSLCPIC